MTADIRRLLNLLETIETQPLTEMYHATVDVMGNAVKVYRNPSHTEFAQLVGHGLRGPLDQNGDLYVWDPSVAIHHSVEAELGLQGEHRMMLYSDRIALEYEVDAEEFSAIPAIQRAYGDWGFDIENDSVLFDDDDDVEDDEDEDEDEDGGW